MTIILRAVLATAYLAASLAAVIRPATAHAGPEGHGHGSPQTQGNTSSLTTSGGYVQENSTCSALMVNLFNLEVFPNGCAPYRPEACSPCVQDNLPPVEPNPPVTNQFWCFVGNGSVLYGPSDQQAVYSWGFSNCQPVGNVTISPSSASPVSSSPTPPPVSVSPTSPPVFVPPPTVLATASPTVIATASPTVIVTASPTVLVTASPTPVPTTTSPTPLPSTTSPSVTPTTTSPSVLPTTPSPTTSSPVSTSPTRSPFTGSPIMPPTPILSTFAPTLQPSEEATTSPTPQPTVQPQSTASPSAGPNPILPPSSVVPTTATPPGGTGVPTSLSPISSPPTTATTVAPTIVVTFPFPIPFAPTTPPPGGRRLRNLQRENPRGSTEFPTSSEWTWKVSIIILLLAAAFVVVLIAL